MSVGAASLGSSLIGGATSIFGNNQAASGQKAAAKQADKAAAIQKAQFEENKNLLLPYTHGSLDAQGQYGAAIGVYGHDAQQRYYDTFQADPGFQSTVNKSLDDTMKRYSIMGRTGGGMASSLMKTGQQALQGAYDKRLAQMGGYADAGRGTAINIAQLGGQAASGQAGSLVQGAGYLAGAGQYQGAGTIGAGNALMSGIQNYASMGAWNAGGAAGNPTVNRAMF